MKKLFASLLLVCSFFATAAEKFDPVNDTTTIVIGYTPGGPNDQLARLIATYANKQGYKVVVSNRPGADAMIAGNVLTSLPADGHTLMVAGIIQTVYHQLMKQEGRTYTDADLTPVAPLSEGYRILFASSKSGITSWQSLVDWTKANPGQLNLAGIQSGIEMEKAKMFTPLGIDVTLVPYKSDPETMVAVGNGSVTIGLTAHSNAVNSLIQAGKVVPIAVVSNKRFPGLPNVVAASEVSPDHAKFPIRYIYHMFLKTGTDPAVIQFWNKVCNDAINDPEVNAAITKMVMVPLGGTPADSKEMLAKDRAMVARSIKYLEK